MLSPLKVSIITFWEPFLRLSLTLNWVIFSADIELNDKSCPSRTVAMFYVSMSSKLIILIAKVKIASSKRRFQMSWLDNYLTFEYNCSAYQIASITLIRTKELCDMSTIRKFSSCSAQQSGHLRLTTLLWSL